MSKNYRVSTNNQVVVDADTRLVVAFGRPLPGNRNDCKAWELSEAKDAVGTTTVIADGGYQGTGLVIPHPGRRGEARATRSAPTWTERIDLASLVGHRRMDDERRLRRLRHGSARAGESVMMSLATPCAWLSGSG